MVRPSYVDVASLRVNLDGNKIPIILAPTHKLRDRDPTPLLEIAWGN